MKKMVEIVVPQLAESLVSATIDKWLKQPGDYVEKYEPICDLLTDKVTAELPATYSGTIKKILVGNGETVPVGTAIALLETSDTLSANDQPIVMEDQMENEAGTQQEASKEQAGELSLKNRYSPAVQQLALEHGIQLSRLTGTGLGGRITRKDVLNYVASGAHEQAKQAPQASEVKEEPVRSTGIHLSDQPPLPKIEVEPFATTGQGESYIDVTPIRSAIARNMQQSATTIPHGWTMIEVDVTNIVLLRNKLKDEFRKREGVNLTYLAFLLKAVVNAIKDYPIMNSSWTDEKIIVKRDINISLAVGTEDSVMTPVIKNADQKNVAGLAREIDELARKTREGKLKLHDMQGGTFTVNNTGSFGSILSYPIINYPQAAIVTFESIVKRPVVINDMIAVRYMANLCLSLDHRILDGVICGRFLQRVKDNLESYNTESTLY
ncbi:dihydrolipoamide acetyltransferase family protein [Paenibacillus yanchengensis]|uniref:Dihydrolipoamide acetyltransferase component of pyruvate dehydrogenase complex n=1 Tax=Paenibacillus yanchengensis TaxID=2035833 RepID=A0ABW4YK19_9BACL